MSFEVPWWKLEFVPKMLMNLLRKMAPSSRGEWFGSLKEEGSVVTRGNGLVRSEDPLPMWQSPAAVTRSHRACAVRMPGSHAQF